MPRYFMKDTRHAWAERMMMDPSRTVKDQSEKPPKTSLQKRGRPTASAHQDKEERI